MIIFLKILIFALPLTTCQLNNACKSFESYFNIYFSPDCFYIPDNYLNAPEIIKHHVGLFEHHKVTTEDGYILGLFRIPQTSPKGVILLQHGFVQDARSWLSQYNESVAFWFWKAGYDVWLSNSRGTFYSQKHSNLTVNDEEFWNFTFHEIGYFDLDAVIKYVKVCTKRPKVILVASSMGFASSLVYVSSKYKEAAENVQILIGLAPVWSLKYTKSLYKWALFPSIHSILKNGLNRFISWHSWPHYDGWMLWTLRMLNKVFPFKKLYIYTESVFCGWSETGFDPSFINLMIDHLGAPSSLKNFEHIYQTINNEEVRMFDYGKSRNLEIYGSEMNPSYLLENVSVPLLLVYGTNDYLTQAGDIDALTQKLPEEAKVFGEMKIEGFSHTDFYFGRHRYEMVYKKVIEFLGNLEE
ncbi:lipase member J [Tribolium castaneum]|uniref:Lipase n=1 Tax=Tribolium castaneum TaxID=7070 RepID=A0A139WJA8_TRICA|nr:PREDICTED: lipase member J-like [Tribolium castaneum]KYB27895.1 Lipase 1-like Protein [Tribolium castaneum]|eukprot:XP_008191751.2 PREDICTED: lipase member J-like [Tribolium castaneum]